MDNTGETHYVSFLSGDSGGMGRSSRSSRVRRNYKRGFFGLRRKLHLLIAAAFVSCLLGFGFLLWLGSDNSESIVPAPPVFTPKEGPQGGPPGAPNGELPLRIQDWSDYHFSLAFSSFMSEHQKAYSSLEEKERRYRIFRANLTHIYLHNEQGHSYKLGMNQFGDLTREEFRHFATGYKKTNYPQKYKLGVAHHLSSRSPSSSVSVDWRQKGCVTPVKDQGQCGSCWAFSATGALEGAWCSQKGPLLSLSEQMLIDCSSYLGNNGCNGGLMDDAFTFVAEHGLCLEQDYPYEAKDRKCRASKCKPQVQIKGFYDVPPRDEEAMKHALETHGPVAIAIQADQIDFQFYKEGVFNANCGTDLDHGVLLVGFGKEETTGKEYFIMKNSWGDKWGMHGYMLMAQHKGPEGQCGLLLSGSFPLVEGEDVVSSN